MGKDSFEDLLRGKVLQAESALNQNSDKEKVWSAIQKKQQPKHKFYYGAAAILFIIGIVSTLYFKSDEVLIVAKKTKTDKPVVASLPKLSIVELTKVKQALAPGRIVKTQELGLAKSSESAAATPNTLAHKEEASTVVFPIGDKAVSAITKEAITENESTAKAPQTIIPEFTVQLKKGRTIESNTDEGVFITSLKKFKLKRDTTYFANAAEKQQTKIKLTFKKEN